MSTERAGITYCGHSTIILESEKGKRFIIDPFLKGNPRCPKELTDPGRIDFICLTHGHSDHSSSAVELAKKYNAQVFATFELANLLQQDGVPQEQIEFMNKGGRVEIPDTDGLAVTLTQAFHSSSYQTSDGTVHYAGEPAGIVIELESGRSIYHAGDTLLFGDMAMIRDRFRPEVVLLPIGDRYTMGPKDAAIAARILQAKHVVPIHFGTFPGLSGDPETFAAAVKREVGQDITRLLEPGERWEF